jgi:hypothetical protein
VALRCARVPRIDRRENRRRYPGCWLAQLAIAYGASLPGHEIPTSTDANARALYLHAVKAEDAIGLDDRMPPFDSTLRSCCRVLTAFLLSFVRADLRQGLKQGQEARQRQKPFGQHLVARRKKTA